MGIGTAAWICEAAARNQHRLLGPSLQKSSDAKREGRCTDDTPVLDDRIERTPVGMVADECPAHVCVARCGRGHSMSLASLRDSG